MNESATLTTEVFFRHLFEHLGVAVIAADSGLRIWLWNHAAARMFGADAAAMNGVPVTSIIPQTRRPQAERMLQQTLATGEVGELEFQEKDAQGRPRELAGTIAPIVDESGQRIGVSLSFRDITRRIALQHEVFEGRKMTALGEMAGAVAHHFNNILGGIITSTDYAADSDDAAVKDRVLRQTSKALIRASGLVKGLSAFAEGDPTGEDLSDFTEVVLDLTDEAESMARRPRITVNLDLPTLPVVPVPRRQTMTVLRNIVQNAVEAMPDGGTLTLRAGVDDEWVTLTVADTGRGMDEAELSRVFEPFWSTKGLLGSNSGAVTGLGLAIAHGLVQMLGGRIRVESTPGAGSRFTVLLPRQSEPGT